MDEIMATPAGIKPKGRNGVVDWDVYGNGFPCAYCERQMVAWSLTHPTKDHVIPKSKGGRKTILACYQCNQIKGDMMPDEWDEFRRLNKMWWRVPSANFKLPRSGRPVCPVITMVADFFVEVRYPYLKRWRARAGTVGQSSQVRE